MGYQVSVKSIGSTSISYRDQEKGAEAAYNKVAGCLDPALGFAQYVEMAKEDERFGCCLSSDRIALFDNLSSWVAEVTAIAETAATAGMESAEGTALEITISETEEPAKDTDLRGSERTYNLSLSLAELLAIRPALYDALKTFECSDRQHVDIEETHFRLAEATYEG